MSAAPRWRSSTAAGCSCVMGVLVLVPLLSGRSGCPSCPRARCSSSSTPSTRVPDGSTRADVVRLRPGIAPGAGAHDEDRAAPAVATSTAGSSSRCCGPAAPALVDQTLEAVAAEYRARGTGSVYGKDYVNLGYKSGNEAVMVLMGQGIDEHVPDRPAPPTSTAARCRSCASVRDYSSFRAAREHLGGLSGHQGVGAAGELALPPADGLGLHGGERARVLPVPAVRPAARPAGRHGRRGRVREARATRRARPRAGMDAQSLAHVFVALCIVLGNVVQWTQAQGGRAHERLATTSASGSARC